MGPCPPDVKTCAVQGWSNPSADGAPQQRGFRKLFGGLPLSSFMGQSWTFWVMTACLPGIQVRLQPCLVPLLLNTHEAGLMVRLCLAAFLVHGALLSEASRGRIVLWSRWRPSNAV